MLINRKIRSLTIKKIFLNIFRKRTVFRPYYLKRMRNNSNLPPATIETLCSGAFLGIKDVLIRLYLSPIFWFTGKVYLLPFIFRFIGKSISRGVLGVLLQCSRMSLREIIESTGFEPILSFSIKDQRIRGPQ